MTRAEEGIQDFHQKWFDHTSKSGLLEAKKSAVGGEDRHKNNQET